jgi:integrase
MTVSPVLDAAGRQRSPATLPGYHAGRPPRNKGRVYPADPPTVEEIIAVMRQTGDDRHGYRLRALIIVLWRGGLRIQEALALGERDLDPRRGSLLVRNGKGGRRREIGMDAWGWEQLRPWLAARLELPVGPLFCVIDGPTRGRPWSSANARVEFRRHAAQAGIRRRFAPHQLRHAHAVELAQARADDVRHRRPAALSNPKRRPLNVIQRQLGHANLGTTSIYLQARSSIDTRSVPPGRPSFIAFQSSHRAERAAPVKPVVASCSRSRARRRSSSRRPPAPKRRRTGTARRARR